MDGLTPQALWTTIRRGRLIQVLAVYLGTSFLVLEAVVELWKDADPELQPRVEAARRAIRALSPDT